MNSSNNHRLRNFLLYSFSILMVSLSTDISIAKQVTFERDYTYQASEYDSKVSCRVNALEQVKRLLLEELGTYLESRTDVRDFKLTKDQIITLTAGIVRTEVVKETWDGKSYWLKARIEADPDEVIKSVDSLRKDHQKTTELEETRRKAAEYLKEMERLKSELALAKGDIKKQGQYNEAVKGLSATDWFKKGYAYHVAKEYQDAINAYTRAIELDPKDATVPYTNRGAAYADLGNHNQAIADYNRAIELTPKNVKAYYNRGIAYFELGNHNQAIADYNRAIGLDPKYTLAYYNRGVAYGELGNYQQEIADYTKAIELNPKYAKAYNNRGIAYGNLGNHNQAIADCTRAIELDPKDAKAYYNRGTVYGNLGNYNQAIADCTRAIELDPKHAKAYYNRGVAYEGLGNLQQAFNNFKVSARLGFKPAQDILRKKGIKW